MLKSTCVLGVLVKSYVPGNGLAIRALSLPSNSAVYALERAGLPINLNKLNKTKRKKRSAAR